MLGCNCILWLCLRCVSAQCVSCCVYLLRVSAMSLLQHVSLRLFCSDGYLLQCISAACVCAMCILVAMWIPGHVGRYAAYSWRTAVRTCISRYMQLCLGVLTPSPVTTLRDICRHPRPKLTSTNPRAVGCHHCAITHHGVHRAQGSARSCVHPAGTSRPSQVSLLPPSALTAAMSSTVSPLAIYP